MHGPATLTVSLPSSWVKSNNLKKGDELNIEEDGKLLRVYPGEERLHVKGIKLDLSELDKESISSIIAVLHKSGYDEVELTFKNPDVVKMIRDIINSMLMGYEIIEQKGNMCIVKNVSGDHPLELDALIRRSFLVALSLAKNSLEEIKKGKNGNLTEVLVLEQTNNKITNYCHRLLNKKPYKDEKTIYTYLVLWILESICDDYRDLIKLFISEPKLVISENLASIYGKVNSLFEEQYGLMYTWSPERLCKIRTDIKSLRQKLLTAKITVQEREVQSYLLSIINRVYESLGSLCGLHF